MIRLTRRFGLGLIAVALLMTTSVAYAAEWVTYRSSLVKAAQEEGRPVLVFVYASWCPYCRAQRPIIEGLLQKPEFADFAYFRVDFDRQQQLLTSLKVRQQSTLIVYRGKDEVARTVGDTNAANIEALLTAAVKAPVKE